MLWREWHRSRPSRWMMALLVFVGGSTGIACIIGAATFWRIGVDPFSSNPGIGAGIFGCILQVLFGLLMLSAVAPMSMSEERQRGSLDLLAATTLSTRAIVLGKWLGTVRLVPFWAIGPGLVGLALATARKTGTRTLPPGLPPDFYKDLSRGERLYGAALLVTTILVHGALLTSLGLALATWIKRQSRAIAISVGLFVMVAIGWPVAVRVSLPGPRGLMCLSPLRAVGDCADLLMHRWFFSRDMLWWITFWDVEVIVLSLGLLWLTVRTFDQCFGRIPERPRRTPLLADVVAILGGMSGAGCLIGAVTIWAGGVTPQSRNGTIGNTALGFTLLFALGLLLISALAPLSMAMERERRAFEVWDARGLSARTFVLGQWWETFRLVLFLALGPVLIALALATAHKTLQVVPKVTALPSGGTVMISADLSGSPIVTTTDPSGARVVRVATPEEFVAATAPTPWELTLGSRLSTAALLVLTILAHGAATTSVGLALATWIRRRRRAVLLSIALFFLAGFVWPVVALLAVDPRYSSGVAMTGVLMSADSLFTQLLSREPQLPGLLAWATLWVVIVSLLAIGLLWWTIRTWERRLGYMPRTDPPVAIDAREGRPTIETALVGD